MATEVNVYKEVWSVLSKVDVSEHAEEKAGLTYLSWAWAWGVLMEHYPDAEYEFLEEKFFSDGSCKVECIICIRGKTRSMWLPVMDYRNNAIENPSSREISDSQMRCLVKCMAMWGLGHYIYAGEDLPSDTPPPPPAKKKASKKADSKKASTSGNGASAKKVHPVVAATRELLVAGAKSIDELTDLWTSNKKDYSALDKKIYDEVVKAFSERKLELKKETSDGNQNA